MTLHTRTTQGRATVRCSDCGQVAETRTERAEMATTWLLAGPGGPVERRFCRGCAPAGPVTDLACARCGDGPLLAGDLAAGDANTGAGPGAVVQAWMSAAGWALTGPVCPSCVEDNAR